MDEIRDRIYKLYADAKQAESLNDFGTAEKFRFAARELSWVFCHVIPNLHVQQHACLCDPPDYPGAQGGWDSDCPVHGDTVTT